MEIFEGLLFESFTEGDIDIITPIMKRAFDEDIRRHTDCLYGGPDGYDNGDFLRKWYINSGFIAYKVSKDDNPIGAFNVWINDNNINYLGNIFVDADYQDKGIGTIIWRFIGTKFPDTVKWCAETPAYSRRNHNFYINKCGFKVVKIGNPMKRSGGQFIMEKLIEKVEKNNAFME
ncbi:MAG: GNAT family N-acetyltransferase [Clostridiales bacterium GWF2_38_85]|nr:MAG: GNAT family N-acetyltransferase [Clostridiales bacterium GWF2_38_85]